ncbi:hypothetical protein [Paraburkholderia strydomiana]|uniref:hypothetical protein n=1 Tax=Paraburkholderia strydomiana TaxID=1245417 RepID=UPI0038B879E5
MDQPIYINGNDSLTLKPQDAATQGVVNHLISAADRRLYACIRAFGYSTLEAAIAAFGKAITAHVDALGDFATAYETTRGYQREYADVREQIGEERLKIEWVKRCDELSVAARDAAMSLRVSLADYKPQVNEFQASKDEAAWLEVAAQRKEERGEATREHHWDLPAQVDGDHSPAVRH